MKQHMNCQEVQERIAGLNDGWLGREEAEQVVAHVKACPECRKDLELDKKLIASLGGLNDASVPAMRWQPGQSRKPAALRLVWLGPVAAVAVALAVWYPSKPAVAPSPTVALTAESKALDNMHMELTLSDAGSDPNRAILVAFSKSSTKEQAQ